jgi:UDP-N-acetylmuramoylalanine--D-glutamate ligase
MHSEEWIQRIRANSCTVVGLGKSNLPLIDFLLSKGARVVARDKKTREELGEVADRLEAKGVALITGERYLDRIDEKIIFRSPGLRPDLPAFATACAQGALMTSEMELFLELCPATVIGITGSDGKTTTTTVTGLLLEAACLQRGKGRVWVGGNIGQPLLPQVEQMSADDFAVVELSSFQLQTMHRSAHYAAITNVTPNHLNWHTDFSEYADAKTNIYRHPPCKMLALNAENEVTRALGKDNTLPVCWFSSLRRKPTDFEGLCRTQDRAIYLANDCITLWDGKRETALLDRNEILLPGNHNLENYMTAIALCSEWITTDIIRTVASSFGGVRHRLERVRVLDGVTYYNSSIDSTPTRTAAALSALAPIRPIVICGGYDKHIPFVPLAESLYQHAKAVILTGATADAIDAALQERAVTEGTPLHVCRESDFTRAVELAHSIATQGDVVLLSPACASFDAFRDFEARGDRFCEIVKSF